MRQHIFDLRRALRRNGTEGNETLVTFPELEKWLERAANHTGHLHFDRHKCVQLKKPINENLGFRVIGFRLLGLLNGKLPGHSMGSC